MSQSPDRRLHRGSVLHFIDDPNRDKAYRRSQARADSVHLETSIARTFDEGFDFVLIVEQ